MGRDLRSMEKWGTGKDPFPKVYFPGASALLERELSESINLWPGDEELDGKNAQRQPTVHGYLLEAR